MFMGDELIVFNNDFIEAHTIIPIKDLFGQNNRSKCSKFTKEVGGIRYR